MNEPFELNIRGQLFQIHPSQVAPPRAVMIALHGLSGDQHSMEIFTRKFHHEFCVVYPRAFFKLENNGFSWLDSQKDPTEEDASDWISAVDMLHFNLELLMVDLGLLGLPQHLIGFSQGAALGLVYSLHYLPDGAKTALMAGFVPKGFSFASKSLDHRTYFIYHGQNDKTIPPEEAARLVHSLKVVGANVEYCESNTGHKLSLPCLRSMEKFFLGDQPTKITGLG
jgi:predicted esterase